MHDSAELIQHLQALLLPHAGVVEAGESRLQRRQQQGSGGWTGPEAEDTYSTWDV